ncbi:MAG: hypothetical protein GX131_17645 [candidate division WS1 bacterium]|nr:hypothetical protein [candidate division WS1 bacterium]
MTLRTPLLVLLACLMATAAWAQAYTAPPGDGPKPAMIVGGSALTPAAWVEGLQGNAVELDGVPMMWIGAAAKAAGGSGTIEATPEGKILRIRAGIRTMEFQILSPGEFWRHPWVRHLIAQANIYQLQPMPYWPYEEANIPSRPPHKVEWKRPYLDWKPDEAWLLLNLEPPPPPVEEVAAAADEPARVTVEAAPAAPAAPPAPPPGMGMEEPPMDEAPPA